MRFTRAICLLPLLATTAFAAGGQLALQDGELLNYRVAWGIFLHAGEITIKARAETNDRRPCVAVTTTTSTRGVLRRLFQFEAQAESVFDRETGRMLVHTETSAGGRKKTNTAIEFNYTNSTAVYTDFFNSANNETVPFPGDTPMDLIMSLVQTRMWDLKPGDARDMDVVFGKDIYQLTVHAIRYEQLETPLGNYQTLVLEPRMEKTPPKGMFKRGSQVHVWIAQNDEQHLPVKFEVEFSFGAGVATLVKYQPPGSVATNATAAAPDSGS
jgi:hypothetical protein